MSRDNFISIAKGHLDLVPERVAIRFEVMPAGIENGTLQLFCSDDLTADKEAQIKFILNRSVQFRPIEKRLLMRSISANYQSFQAEIIRCGTPMRYRCPKEWENLEVMDDLGQRFCGQCNEVVYLCSSVHQAKELGSSGKCVAFYDPVSEGMLLGEIEE